MRTVKQVSNLTGISVRMLHYYDEIELLKPTTVTKAGYRLYDNNALFTLQQILFFKELDIPLKQIREIMNNPKFDKMQALRDQKKLLIIKRNKLNNLITLLNKTLKGENIMSFKEFDMTDFFNLLEEFKKENKNRVIQNFGDTTEFDKMVKAFKDNENVFAKNAIEEYGSIKNYTASFKETLNNDTLKMISDSRYKFENDLLKNKHPILRKLYKELTADINKDPNAPELQNIAKQITAIAKKNYEIFKMDEKGDDRWYYTSLNYVKNSKWIESLNKTYGIGASNFIGKVFKIYMKDKKPKLEMLYEKLTNDLSKNPASKEVQEIVKEIACTTKSNNEFYKGNMGLDYKAFFSHLADLYLSNLKKDNNALDVKYGTGACTFIGKALKFYSQSNF